MFLGLNLTIIFTLAGKLAWKQYFEYSGDVAVDTAGYSIVVHSADANDSLSIFNPTYTCGLLFLIQWPSLVLLLQSLFTTILV